MLEKTDGIGSALVAAENQPDPFIKKDDGMRWGKAPSVFQKQAKGGAFRD